MNNINDIYYKQYLKYKKKYIKLKNQIGSSNLSSDISSDISSDLSYDKIIISLTTIRRRIDKLHIVLDSICKQEMQADEIFVFVSEKPYLLDTGFSIDDQEEISRLSSLYTNVKFCFVENIGSYRKLIPILEILNKRQQKAFIITIDDDCSYEPQMIKKLYNTAIKNGLCITCGRARSVNIATTDFENTNITNFKMVFEGNQIDFMNVLPEGVGSICYHTSMFDDYTFDINKLSNFERKNDDIVFRKITFNKNIPVRVLNIKYNDMMPNIGLHAFFNAFVGLNLKNFIQSNKLKN